MASISDLSRNEKIALVALMKAIALANQTITESEMGVIDRVASELGEEEYRLLLDEADNSFADLEDLKTALAGIDSKETRDIIYGTAWEESAADPLINHMESELLDWLKTTWNIEESS